jgi:putative oxidoreductase
MKAACLLAKAVYQPTMQQHFSDLGKLLIRLAAGGLMLFHGVSDILKGPGEVMKIFAAQGLPTFFAYGIYLGELIAPVLILIGFLARPAGILVAGTMIVAVLTAHMSQIFAMDDYGALVGLAGAFPLGLSGKSARSHAGGSAIRSVSAHASPWTRRGAYYWGT